MTPLRDESTFIATVSLAFVEDWLLSLRSHCTPAQYASFLEQAAFTAEFFAQANARVTHDQIVKLYQVVSIGTNDEMMGLWSRPIRAGALKHLCTTMIEASSLRTALYRFTRFWNLLLDDFELLMVEEAGTVQVRLSPRTERVNVHRFGHMLLLKLTHGVVSWLAGRELPVAHVEFAFSRPHFSEDYPLLFPSAVSFGGRFSCIGFERSIVLSPIDRRIIEMREFLVRAPRDWIFTSYKEHSVQLKVRQKVHEMWPENCTLKQVARVLNMSPRTLTRRLAKEYLTFQGIKDALRRDIAIRDLTRTTKSVEAIAYDVGFSSPAVFHRAFRQWTGTTPVAYRRQFQQT